MSLFDCQIASVGRELIAVVTIAMPPGCTGGIGFTNGATTSLTVRSEAAVRIDVMSTRRSSKCEVAGSTTGPVPIPSAGLSYWTTAWTVAEVAGVWTATLLPKKDLGPSGPLPAKKNSSKTVAGALGGLITSAQSAKTMSFPKYSKPAPKQFGPILKKFAANARLTVDVPGAGESGRKWLNCRKSRRQGSVGSAVLETRKSM